jgi:hypothetical protein
MVTGVLIPLVLLAAGMTDTESYVNRGGKELAGVLENLIWYVAVSIGIFFVFRMLTDWFRTAMPEDRSMADIRAQLAKDSEAGVVLKVKGLESPNKEASPVAVRKSSDLPPSNSPVRKHRAAFRLQPVANGAEHPVVRAASYLDRWMWQHRHHFPRTGRLPFAYAPAKGQIRLPVVTGVTTGSVQAWSKAERKRLFRVVYSDAWENGQGFLEVPIDVLAVNWSAEKTRLDTDALVEAALAVSAGGRSRGRLSPRMIWFRLTQGTGRLKRTMESYIDEMQLDEDGKAALPKGRKVVWEEQSVPLKEGHRTPLGRGCFFIVHTITPYGCREPLWLFSVERDDVPILKDQRLRAPNFIEVNGTLLATIVSVNETSVTLKVLAPGSEAVSLKAPTSPDTSVSSRSLFRRRF